MFGPKSHFREPIKVRIFQQKKIFCARKDNFCKICDFRTCPWFEVFFKLLTYLYKNHKIMKNGHDSIFYLYPTTILYSTYDCSAPPDEVWI